jgi:hypothetical protein
MAFILEPGHTGWIFGREIMKPCSIILFQKKIIHELYNGSSPTALVDWYKKEFEIAKSLNVRYMVMHIADMDIHDIYTGDYKYTDEEIVSCAVDLINQAFYERQRHITSF